MLLEYPLRAQILSLGHFQSIEHLNIPSFLFPGVAGLETAHTGNFSYTKHIVTSPHPPINELAIKPPEKCQPAVAEKWTTNTRNGGPTRQDSYFLSPFMPKTAEMALPVLTKTFLSRSPDTAMLFAPSGCTHPPPPVPPFLLSQNLSPKDIAGCDIMKLKVSRCRYATLGLKGLT